jgi:small subunit ribosomal protein S4
LKKYMDIAKRLIASTSEQGEKEKQQILGKLENLGLISAGADLNTVLGLEVKDILNRRLQSVVYRKGFARTMKQARQFIVHRHISIGNKEMTVPSYLVSLAEESNVNFKQKSSLFNEDHPERTSPEAVVEQEVEKVTGKKKESKIKAKEPKVAVASKDTAVKEKVEEKNEEGNE